MNHYRFSVAPMLDWTDRHCRFFYRTMSQHAQLYSEMVTTGAIIHGDRDRHLAFTPDAATVLQLGGSDPEALAKSAKIGEEYGYHEINLNCGCPSDRVQKGRFGACLMAEPQLVADCYQAMSEAVSIPVTIKARIGIDEEESYDFLHRFIEEISQRGCEHFILHARKAWLSGLSPKENRDIPPLNYERVYEMKRAFPHLILSINGGIKSFEEVHHHLTEVDGVMLGREVYSNPYLMADVDREIFGSEEPKVSRYEVLLAMEPYIEAHLSSGGKLHQVVRHMLGLFQNLPNSRLWRRYLSENMHREGADFSVVMSAYERMKNH